MEWRFCRRGWRYRGLKKETDREHGDDQRGYEPDEHADAEGGGADAVEVAL
jgi:hypothetical protein